MEQSSSDDQAGKEGCQVGEETEGVDRGYQVRAAAISKQVGDLHEQLEQSRVELETSVPEAAGARAVGSPKET